MLIPPRIIAIDDNVAHLHALAKGLNETGAACLTFPFINGDIKLDRLLRGIRAVFIDLHLAQSSLSSDETPNFAVIATLLTEHLDPLNGPFALFLWTEYSEHCAGLTTFLEERAPAHAIPVATLALKKGDFLDATGNFVNADQFCREVAKLVATQPQVAALINWESRIAGAASDTVATLLGLAPRASRSGPGLRSELERLLSVLATESVGASHVGSDRLAAVNEALLPILYDRMSQIRSDRSEQRLWKKAIPSPGQPAFATMVEAARLNTLLHWDLDVSKINGGGRGAVLLLSANFLTEDGFRSRFGLAITDAARRQFGLTGFPNRADLCRWMLVQVQAVCDHAQSQAGPLPYVLGLEFPADIERAMDNIPDAVWNSPVFESANRASVLSVNFRFGTSIVRQDIPHFQVAYRLREQLMNDLGSTLHSYGARPGFTSFRQQEVQIKSSSPEPTDEAPPEAQEVVANAVQPSQAPIAVETHEDKTVQLQNPSTASPGRADAPAKPQEVLAEAVQPPQPQIPAETQEDKTVQSQNPNTISPETTDT